MINRNTGSQKTLAISDSLKAQSIEVLRKILRTQTEWVKVHAAEYLLWSGHPEGVQKAYLEEEKQFGHKCPYRIGIWRVLAQTEKKATEKKVWIGKVLNAFLETNGSDRIHAVESLAKLKISPLAYDAVATRMALESPIRNLSLYTLWSHAFSSPDARLKVKKSFFNIVISRAEDNSSKKLAAYVVRHLGGLSVEEWEEIAKASLTEPHESEARVNLLSSAFVTVPDDFLQSNLYRDVYLQLLNYKDIPSKHGLIEIASALAEKGQGYDLPILISFLRDQISLGSVTDAADVQASAAYAILKIGSRPGV